MKNLKIQYKTSTDYNRLYELLPVFKKTGNCDIPMFFGCACYIDCKNCFKNKDNHKKYS